MHCEKRNIKTLEFPINCLSHVLDSVMCLCVCVRERERWGLVGGGGGGVLLSEADKLYSDLKKDAWS